MICVPCSEIRVTRVPSKSAIRVYLTVTALIVTGSIGFSAFVGTSAILSATSMPLSTRPKTA